MSDAKARLQRLLGDLERRERAVRGGEEAVAAQQRELALARYGVWWVPWVVRNGQREVVLEKYCTWEHLWVSKRQSARIFSRALLEKKRD